MRRGAATLTAASGPAGEWTGDQPLALRADAVGCRDSGSLDAKPGRSARFDGILCSLYVPAMAAANASARGQRAAILASPLHELTGFYLAVDCLAPRCNGERRFAVTDLATFYGRDTTFGRVLPRMRCSGACGGRVGGGMAGYRADPQRPRQAAPRAALGAGGARVARGLRRAIGDPPPATIPAPPLRRIRAVLRLRSAHPFQALGRTRAGARAAVHLTSPIRHGGCAARRTPPVPRPAARRGDACASGSVMRQSGSRSTWLFLRSDITPPPGSQGLAGWAREPVTDPMSDQARPLYGGP